MAMLKSFWAAEFFPNFGWILDVITGLHMRLESCFPDFDAFFKGLIDEHLDLDRPRPEHKDIIDVLLEVSKDETPSTHLSRDHIKSILMAFTELARNPRVMKKAQVEIRSCAGRKPKVSENEISKLIYLKKCGKGDIQIASTSPSTIASRIHAPL
ncbi:Cytochrome [Abeliophyllum distichum]|uniref:Cytochrome n=1 Tax=Abeliophyllum distichum TaxID=126358 RepID=A0ABD1Q3X2_9LAMI